MAKPNLSENEKNELKLDYKNKMNLVALKIKKDESWKNTSRRIR